MQLACRVLPAHQALCRTLRAFCQRAEEAHTGAGAGRPCASGPQLAAGSHSEGGWGHVWAAAPEGQELSRVWERCCLPGCPGSTGQCFNSHLGKQQLRLPEKYQDVAWSTGPRGSDASIVHTGAQFRPSVGPSLSFEAFLSYSLDCLMPQAGKPSSFVDSARASGGLCATAGPSHLTASLPGGIPASPPASCSFPCWCLEADVLCPAQLSWGQAESSLLKEAQSQASLCGLRVPHFAVLSACL